VPHVLLADALGLRVRAEVVVAVRQAQAALVHLADHLRRVLVVLIGAEIERRVDALLVEAREERGQIGRGGDRVDRCQVVLERLGALLVGRVLVHAGRVEIA
jgi:hypothetical protein